MRDTLRPMTLDLDLLADPVALCQLSPHSSLPGWIADATQFLTVSRTPTELSIAADERAVPTDLVAKRGYRALRVRGPLAFELTGIMASLAVPLARAGVSIFPIATVETDYVLVHDRDLARAVAALERAGHAVHR
jgi:hypothetical protein